MNKSLRDILAIANLNLFVRKYGPIALDTEDADMQVVQVVGEASNPRGQEKTILPANSQPVEGAQLLQQGPGGSPEKR